MIKRFFIFILILLFSVGLFSPIMAKEPVVPQEVNSFELFWPVSAGKVMGESLYGLKTFKEKLRGLLIFGKPQKADYALFLATKRLVETEKLLGEEKTDLAKKTLEKMLSQLKVASKNLESNEGIAMERIHELNNKLDDLETFLPFLVSKYESTKTELEANFEKVKSINQKI